MDCEPSTGGSATVPASASPGSEEHLALMRLALAEAHGALEDEEVPVGCVITHRGRVLAAGRNQTNATKNGTRHCEFVALESLSLHADPAVRNVDLGECVLYVTIEPCIMCASALRLVGIGLVVYGCGNERFGGNGSTLPLHLCPSIDDASTAAAATAASSSAVPSSTSSSATPASADSLPALQGRGYPTISGVLGVEAVDVLKRFYARGNQNIPLERRHRKGVLAAAAAAEAEATAVALESPPVAEPTSKRSKVAGSP